MLAGRELNINELPVEIRNDWYKQTYTYTHGYGAVVSPVNEIVDGNPTCIFKACRLLTMMKSGNTGLVKPRDPVSTTVNARIATLSYTQIAPRLEFDYPQEGAAVCRIRISRTRWRAAKFVLAKTRLYAQIR